MDEAFEVGVFDVERGVHGSREVVVCCALEDMDAETIAEDVRFGAHFKSLGFVVMGVCDGHAMLVFALAEFLGVEPVHEES